MTEFRARRTPVHRGPAAWSAILPPQSAPVELDSDQSVDFAVIGGGFAGLSAAERLRQLNEGARIVVLEAGRLAEGASGRNSGFMIDLPHELSSEDYADGALERQRALIALNRKAIEFGKAAVENYGIEPAYFRPVGKINGAADEAGLEINSGYARKMELLNEPSEFLDAKAMHLITGSRYYPGGLYTPGTVVLQPAGYIRSLGEGLRADVGVFENSPALSIAKNRGDWLIRTPAAAVTANKVILANNGHLESFGFLRNRLMHVFLFAIMTPDLGKEIARRIGGADRWGITPAVPMGSTVRRISGREGGDRIVLRSCASFRPGMQATRSDLERARRSMQKKFDDRFPALAGTGMEFAWAGHLCLSRNGVTVLREIEDRMWAACCQNGLGTTRGTLTGMAAAELASGCESEIAEFFGTEPDPERLPPPPISTVAGNVALRWKELKARRA